MAFDQGLHCLLTDCSIKIWENNTKIAPNAPKIGNGPLQLIAYGNSIPVIWVIETMVNTWFLILTKRFHRIAHAQCGNWNSKKVNEI